VNTAVRVIDLAIVDEVWPVGSRADPRPAVGKAIISALEPGSVAKVVRNGHAAGRSAS
jgi:hypothetical protein